MDAEDLYRLPPQEFTAARDAEAKRRRGEGDEDGAAAIKALRRPSVAAWLLNRLVATSPDLLAGLLELGPGLAQAQSAGDAAALRSLGAQRRQLVEAVTSAAVTAGGRAVTAAIREEVAGTLEAALSDPGSTDAVRSGRLVRSLSYAGFGEVDLSDAVAPVARSASRAAEPEGTPSRGPEARPKARSKGRSKARSKAQVKADAAVRAREQHAARLAAAQQAAQDAAGALDDAVRACESAERTRVQAQREADELAAEVERRAAALAEAKQEHERAGAEASTARRETERAGAKVERAQARAEATRAELDRLRRQGPPSA